MKLELYLELAKLQPKCIFCTFADQFEDMEESNGKFYHLECARELQSIAQGDRRDNHNGNHLAEMEQ